MSSSREESTTPIRRSLQWRNTTLRLLPLATILLIADLAEPGWGRFPNPVFYSKWAVTRLQEQLDKDPSAGVPLADTRLSACRNPAQTTAAGLPALPQFSQEPSPQGQTDQQLPSDAMKTSESRLSPSTITDTQAALRDSLIGEHSVVAVQRLGNPACQLMNGSYRWLLESGLSLDVQITNTGTVHHATLKN